MSFNKSPLAFDDIRQAFDKALGAKKGARINCVTRGAAITLRSRFNYFRKIDRMENRTVYPPDHPMHGKSHYDKLVLRIPPKGSEEQAILYIEHRLVENMLIEEIE